MAEPGRGRNSPGAASPRPVAGMTNDSDPPPLSLPGAKHHFAAMDDPSTLVWLAAAAFAALAALAGWADHRRANRRDVDKPGWVPWQPLLVLAMMACVVCAALGILV